MRGSRLERGRWLVSLVAGVAWLGVAGGCASTGGVTPSNEIATAMFAIRDAKVSGAETLAAAELARAEDLLAAAQQTSGAEAERLADQAAAQAQLAAAVAKRERARERLAEARRVQTEAGNLKERTTDAVMERMNR